MTKIFSWRQQDQGSQHFTLIFGDRMDGQNRGFSTISIKTSESFGTVEVGWGHCCDTVQELKVVFAGCILFNHGH